MSEDYMLVGPKCYALYRAELAALEASKATGFDDLDWRRQKRTLNRARRSARHELRSQEATENR